MQTIKNLILFLVAKATQKVSELEFLVSYTFVFVLSQRIIVKGVERPESCHEKNISELQAFRSSLFQILLGPMYAAASGCQPYHTSCCHILL